MSAESQTDASVLNETPRYSIPQAAHYLHLPGATLRSWVIGRRYRVQDGQKEFRPLIQKPDPDDSRLSFANLTEAFVLRALRAVYRVSMADVRAALDYAGVDERLFLSEDLRATPGKLFLDRVMELVHVGVHGIQPSFRSVLEAHLRRIDYSNGLVARLYPIVRTNGHEGPRVVAIRPEISFGKPVVERKAIKTATVAERFRLGEPIEFLADDYSLGTDEVEEAIRYEGWNERERAA